MMDTKERRKFPRFDCSLKVDYSTLGIASIESQSIVKNISADGVCVPISKMVRKGTVIRLYIFDRDKEAPVPATGRVKWLDGTKGSRFDLDAGIEFTNIKSYDVDRLLATVQ